MEGRSKAMASMRMRASVRGQEIDWMMLIRSYRAPHTCNVYVCTLSRFMWVIMRKQVRLKADGMSGGGWRASSRGPKITIEMGIRDAEKDANLNEKRWVPH